MACNEDFSEIYCSKACKEDFWAMNEKKKKNEHKEDFWEWVPAAMNEKKIQK